MNFKTCEPLNHFLLPLPAAITFTLHVWSKFTNTAMKRGNGINQEVKAWRQACWQFTHQPGPHRSVSRHVQNLRTPQGDLWPLEASSCFSYDEHQSAVMCLWKLFFPLFSLLSRLSSSDEAPATTSLSVIVLKHSHQELKCDEALNVSFHSRHVKTSQNHSSV